VALLALTALGVLLTKAAVSIVQRRIGDGPPAAWRYSASAWLGLRKAMPILLGAVCAFILLAWLAGLGRISPVPHILPWLLLGLTALLAGTGALVFLVTRGIARGAESKPRGRLR
jgi:hypothetical protein